MVDYQRVLLPQVQQPPGGQLAALHPRPRAVGAGKGARDECAGVGAAAGGAARAHLQPAGGSQPCAGEQASISTRGMLLVRMVLFARPWHNTQPSLMPHPCS